MVRHKNALWFPGKSAVYQEVCCHQIEWVSKDVQVEDGVLWARCSYFSVDSLNPMKLVGGAYLNELVTDI